MMRHQVILLLLGVLLFGCTSNQEAPGAMDNTTINNRTDASVSPPIETLTLPPISEGRYCIFSASGESMACNFDGLAVMRDTNGFNMTAGTEFHTTQCAPISILLLEEKQVVMLYPFGEELIQVNDKTSGRMLERRLMDPCTIGQALINGKPGEGYCLYNSTLKEIECWKNVSFLREGIFHNYTGTPVKVDWCGLTGAYYPDTNDSDLIFIWENRDTLFRMDNETSVQAIATQMAGNNCSS